MEYVPDEEEPLRASAENLLGGLDSLDACVRIFLRDAPGLLLLKER